MSLWVPGKLHMCLPVWILLPEWKLVFKNRERRTLMYYRGHYNYVASRCLLTSVTCKYHSMMAPWFMITVWRNWTYAWASRGRFQNHLPTRPKSWSNMSKQKYSWKDLLWYIHKYQSMIWICKGHICISVSTNSSGKDPEVMSQFHVMSWHSPWHS